MLKISETQPPATADSKPAMPTEHLQVVELLSRDEDASIEEMSVLADWLYHSIKTETVPSVLADFYLYMADKFATAVEFHLQHNLNSRLNRRRL